MLDPLVALLARLGIELSTDVLDPGRALGFAGEALGSLGSVLTNSFFILLAVIFILTEAWSFPRKLGAVLAHPERDLPHFKRFAEKLNRYFAIKTTVSIAHGHLRRRGAVAARRRLPGALGPCRVHDELRAQHRSVIAAVPPVLLAVIQLVVFGALATAAVFVVVNVVMGSVVEPKFMGRELGLSPGGVPLLVFWGGCWVRWACCCPCR